MGKISLNGGVIIIGSLFWEDHLDFKLKNDFIRQTWRNQNLNVKGKISIPLPIRYGRISRTRFNTYTMIFCNSVDTDQSRGLIVPLLKKIKSFEELNIQAIALAIAEGIYKKNNNRRITASWGTVGILINPKLEQCLPSVYSYIVDKWICLYSDYQNTFCNENFTVSNVAPVIDQNGFLQIKWEEEFNDFDFLFAATTAPYPRRLISEDQVTSAILQSKNEVYPDGYSEYFYRNRAEGIVTGQDERIIEILNQKKEN